MPVGVAKSCVQAKVDFIAMYAHDGGWPTKLVKESRADSLRYGRPTEIEVFRSGSLAPTRSTQNRETH